MNHDAPADTRFEVEVNPEAGGATVAVTGEIDVATSPALRRALHRMLDEGTSRIVVDLSRTTFIDSSGLGVLVGALKRLREDDGNDTIVLTGLQDPVRKVFEITGLTALFNIQD